VLNKHNEIVASAPMDKTLVMQFVSQINSYLGIMKHYQTYRLRKNGITKKMNPAWWKYIFVVGLFWKVVRNKRALPL
jgi:hypothetical protein